MRKQVPNSQKGLIPFDMRTPQERIEMGRKGGFRSGVTKRERATLKKTLLELLDKPMKKGPIHEITTITGAKGKNFTGRQAMAIAALQRALLGDVAALAFVRDSIGEKPVEQVQDVTEECALTDEELEAIITGDKKGK